MRRSYDTSLKHLARMGLIDAVPQSMLCAIPSSNIHRWRNESPDKYLGCALNEIARQKMEILQQFARHQKAQSIFLAYLRIAVTIKRIMGQASDIKKLLHPFRTTIADTVQRARTVLGLKKAARLFGLSASTLYNWIIEAKTKCSFSYLQVCARARPNQLTTGEASKIRQLVTDDRFRFWPLSSIAFYALRNNLINVSLATFYKYARLMGIKRPRFIKPALPGLKAAYAHQYWHADVTVFKINGIKHYLYFVADNYSRHILNFRCERMLRGTIVRQMLSETIAKYAPEKASLLVDGGPENNNCSVDEMLHEKSAHIVRIVAQKDISFSNSMIEAINKIIKNNYLHLMSISSEKQLKEKLAFAVNDYNAARPHLSLNGYTPLEALAGQPVNKQRFSQQIAQARTERIAHNRKSNCKGCIS